MLSKNMLSNLYKRAEGFLQTETTTEYVIDENGVKRPIKERTTSKEMPPDVQAFKLYMELTDYKSEFEGMSDEELTREKERLLRELKSDS